MKKILSFLMLTLLTAGFSAKAADQIYAVWDNTTTTLTLRYDDQLEANNGVTEWWKDATMKTATTVVLDESMQAASPESTADWFLFFSKLKDIQHLDYLNTSEVTSMKDMFFGCESLTSLDLGNFNTAKVKDMNDMFYKCASLTSLDLSSFNTVNVTGMISMFSCCKSLTSLDLSSFNTANVKVMSAMFALNPSLQSVNLSSFNTARVTDMSMMFSECSSLTSLDLSSLNTVRVKNMEEMFSGCSSLKSLDLSNFNTAKVEKMKKMFYGCEVLTTIFCDNDWSTSSAESVQMFYGCSNLKGGNETQCDGTNNIDKSYAHLDEKGSHGYFTAVSQGITPTVKVNGYGTIPTKGMEITLNDVKKVSASGKLQMELRGTVAAKGTLTVTIARSSDGITDDFCHAGKCTNGNGTKQQTITFQNAGTVEWFVHYKTEKETVETIVYTFSDETGTRVLTVHYDSHPSFPKKHLIEEFTGQECRYCPKGMDSLQAFMGNEEKWILVVHHNFYDDHFTIDGSKTIASELEVTAVPSACFNRKETTEGFFPARDCFRKIDQTELGDRTYASIVLNNSYDAATRTLAVHVEGRAREEMQNLRLTVLVKESGMIDYQLDVDKTLEQYRHNDAVRAFLTDAKGDKVDVTGNRYAADYTIVLNDNWKPRNCTVVAFLTEDFMPVVQAEQQPVIVYKQIYTEYKDGVLTYYCDGKMDSRKGTTETYDPVNEPNKARFAEYAKDVTKAVIDPSMKDTMLTSLTHMFYGGVALGKSYTLEKLTKIEGMENLNTEKAEDMSYMFYDCKALESINLSSFSTANVTTMERMFDGCRTLTTLDVRRFNINKVTNMVDMFAYCFELTTIYCNDDWSQSTALKNGYEMFEEDIKLVGSNGTKWTEWSKDEEGARPDKDGQKGYFTERTLLNVTVSGYGAIPAAGMEITLKDAKMDNTTGKLQMLLEGYVAAEGTLTVTVSRSSDGIVDDFCHAGKCTTGNGTQQQTFTYQSTGNTEWSAHYKPSAETVETIVYTFSDGFETRVLTVHYDSQKIFSVEAYTVYESESNGHSILTLYYDKNRYTHTGENVKKVESYEQGKELKNYYPSEVVIDESFKNVKLTSLAGMFSYLSQTKEIKGLGNIDCSEVTDMSYMFGGCRALTSLDLSSFNTAKVQNMSGMFWECEALETVKFGESFNTANVTDMSKMFSYCKALKSLDLSNFNTANVTNIKDIFDVCKALETIKFGEDFAAKVTDLSQLFAGCEALKSLDLSSFNTANVTDMAYMFQCCEALETIKFGEDFAANVTNMLGMFRKCSSLKSLDLSSFNTAKVQSMYGMFEECTALETVKFGEAFAANVIDMREMFQDCSSLKSLDLSSFNTANVQSMYSMFYNCTALETIKFGESFNTANVIDMGFMFGACLSLKSLDISSFNTAKLQSMMYMFASCSSLESLDISNFNIDKVIYMDRMFGSCSALTTIYCDDDWSTSTADSEYMFYGCSKLKGGNGTEWTETNPTNKSYARLDKEGEPGYFTSAKILKQQKDELNALIQEMKALYDFAKQYVAESELTDMKKSIEGFEAVYNNSAAAAEVSKAVSDAQAALKNVKATVMPACKTAAKATLDGMLQAGDSDNCKNIINDAKGKIDALAWDDTKTAEENKAILEPAIKKIIEDAENALAAERGTGATTTDAAKEQLNAAIQDLKALYDFAKQYVGESELANLKRSIEGFEAVYNDKTATVEDINKAASEAQATVKNVKTAMMSAGKTILKSTLNGMLLPTDSEEAKDIIKYAKDMIDILAWDDTKTVEENIAALEKAVKAIMEKAEKDIEATRNTGIDEVESQKTKAGSIKVIRNGQVLIIHEGKTYTLTGAEVR